MIKIEINGELYTSEQYQHDLHRFWDSIREKKYINEKTCIGVSCKKCILFQCDNPNLKSFGEKCTGIDPHESLANVERVYMWAKAHPDPRVTNRDKFIEIFGYNLPFNTVHEFGQWLNEEYEGEK